MKGEKNGIPKNRKTEDRQENFHQHRKENQKDQCEPKTEQRGNKTVSKRPYHQKEPGMMKVRYAINIENYMLEEIEDVSQTLELPRSKVTRALLRYGLDNITTKQIYELGKD